MSGNEQPNGPNYPPPPPNRENPRLGWRRRRSSLAFVMSNQHLVLMTSGTALIPSLNTGWNV